MRSAACLVASVLSLVTPAVRAAGYQPIEIPAEPLVKTRFALTVLEICKRLQGPAPASALRPMPGDRVAIFRALTGDLARPNAIADYSQAISSLKETCDHLAGSSLGTLVVAADLEVLRGVFTDPQAVSARVSRLVDGSAESARAAVRDARAALGAVASLGDVIAPSGLESRLIEGLGEFVLDRAKAEAALALSERFRDQLCKRDEVRLLLENLCAAITALDPSQSLHSIGALLRTAAETDLRNLPDRLLAKLGEQTWPTQDGAVSLAQPVAAARVGLAFYREARQGRPLDELGRGVHGLDALGCESAADAALSCKETLLALRLASLFFHAAQAQDGIDAGTRQPDELLVYAIGIGFTVEKYLAALPKDSPLAGVKGALKLPDDPAFRDALARLVGATARTAERVRALQQLLLRLPKADPWERARGVAQMLAILVAGLEDLDGAFRPGGADPALAARVREVKLVAELGAQLLASDNPATLATASQQLLARLRWSQAAGPGGGPSSDPWTAISGVIGFVVELANASSSDEVAKTIEAAAAPVGSYKLKYQRPLVSISSLVGMSWGGETLLGPESYKWGSQVGAFVPIGLQWSRPCSLGSVKFYCGALFSVLDLGAVVSKRLDAEAQTGPSETPGQVTTPGDLKLKQVFAPGVMLNLGLFELPLVLSVGAAYHAGGRLFTPATALGEPAAAPVERSTIQVVGSLAIDVTILPF